MAKLEDVQAVIFDLDGVLIDSETIHQKRNEAMFRDYGWEVDPKVLTDDRLLSQSQSLEDDL